MTEIKGLPTKNNQNTFVYNNKNNGYKNKKSEGLTGTTTLSNSPDSQTVSKILQIWMLMHLSQQKPFLLEQQHIKMTTLPGKHYIRQT